MEETDHVEIYQAIVVFCCRCRFIYGWRSADGSDSAGDYEPGCRRWCTWLKQRRQSRPVLDLEVWDADDRALCVPVPGGYHRIRKPKQIYIRR